MRQVRPWVMCCSLLLLSPAITSVAAVQTSDLTISFAAEKVHRVYRFADCSLGGGNHQPGPGSCNLGDGPHASLSDAFDCSLYIPNPPLNIEEEADTTYEGIDSLSGTIPLTGGCASGVFTWSGPLNLTSSTLEHAGSGGTFDEFCDQPLIWSTNCPSGQVTTSVAVTVTWLHHETFDQDGYEVQIPGQSGLIWLPASLGQTGIRHLDQTTRGISDVVGFPYGDQQAVVDRVRQDIVVTPTGEFPCDPGAGADSRTETQQTVRDASRTGAPGVICGISMTTPDPVDLATGDKIDEVADLVVAVTGGDFVLSRSYNSDPDYSAPRISGSHWTLSPFRMAKFTPGSNPVLRLGGWARSAIDIPINGAGPTWPVPGATAQHVRKADLAIEHLHGGLKIPVWRLVQPGEGDTDFYRANDASETGPEWFTISDTGSYRDLCLQSRDVYGNSRTFYYALIGLPTKVARLSHIELNRREGQLYPEADVRFIWNISGSAVIRSRLSEVQVIRYADDQVHTQVVTQKVKYRYMVDSDTTLSNDLGTDGDLIQVTRSTRVDTGSSAQGPWNIQITQYRYHGNPAASAGGGTYVWQGEDHQLKMVIQPEQIEYAAQIQGTHVSPGPVSITSFATGLLGRADGATAHSNVPYLMTELAAKVIEKYEPYVAGSTLTNQQGRVLTQYIQSACGCSGSSQGLQLNYSHTSYTYPAPDSSPGHTLKVIEKKRSGASWVVHRTVYHDTKWIGPAPPAGQGDTRVPYPITEAIVDGTSKWVTHRIYDTAKRTLRRLVTPTAVATYTPSSGDGVKPVITFRNNAGMVHACAYTADELELPTDERIGQGLKEWSGSTLGTLNDTLYTLVSRTTYGDADGSGSEWNSINSRPFLPSRIEKFRTATSTAPDDVEVTKILYGFFDDGGVGGPPVDSDAIAWTEARVEAELGAENGPGGTYRSHELFDEQGRNFWSRAADNSLTRREFDQRTGEKELVERNASPGAPAALPASPYHGLQLSGSDWSGRNGDGGSLITRSVVDMLGREQARTSPGGVNVYTVRQMRTFAQRPGLVFYSEIGLPHKIASGVFDGPATVTWFNAAGDVIGASEYLLDPPNGYSFPTLGADSTGYSVVVSSVAITYTSDVSEIARTAVSHHLSGLVQSTRVWHDVNNSAPVDTVSYLTSYTYDSLGRVLTTTDPQGTITRNTYDVINRVTQVEIGTSEASPAAGGNMVVVAKNVYDSTTDTSGVGNGNLTRARQVVDASAANDRVTDYSYDFRDRLVKTVNPATPHELVAYDNLDRVIKQATYQTSTLPVDPTGNAGRVSYVETDYSQRGLVYRMRVAIDPSLPQASLTFLESHGWFDETGQAVGAWGPNGPGRKTTYDGLGRPVTVYTTDRGAPGGSTPDGIGAGSFARVYDSAAHAAVVDGDVVFEQSAFRYIPGDGLLDLVTVRQRTHDATDADTGDLAQPPFIGGAGGGAKEKLVITSYSATYYDAADRVTHSANYGTNTASGGGFAYGGSVPTVTQGSPPAPSDSVLVGQTTYNARGLIDTTTDPMGRKTRVFYDDMDRQTATIENYVDGSFAWSTAFTPARWVATNAGPGDDDRITSFVYDGNSNVTQQIAHMPNASVAGDKDQVTRYEFGVDTDTVGNPLASKLVARGLVGSVIYPQESAGSPSEADRTEFYAYNRAGELITTEDQEDTRHTYTLDDLGRVTQDKATVPAGSPVDMTAVTAINWTFDAAGRLSKATSIRTGTTVANEVMYSYTPLGHIQHVDQDHDSAVQMTGNPPVPSAAGNTRRVTYTYDDKKLTSGTNDNFSRVSMLKYPNGAAIDYFYGAGASGTTQDSGYRIGRLNQIHRNGTGGGGPADLTYAKYQYVGSSMPVIGDLPVPNIQLDRTASHDGKRTWSTHTENAGTYPGLDRFGRVVRQMWVKGTFTQHTPPIPGAATGNIPPHVETAYSYDRASNRLTAYDERPGANGAMPGYQYSYDELHRLSESKRGTWNPATQLFSAASPVSLSQKWNLDLLGNWQQSWTDRNADGVYTDASEREDRTHNGANELTQRVLNGQAPGGGGGNITLNSTLDRTGNLRTEDRQIVPLAGAVAWRYTHDAWGRLVKIEQQATPTTWTVKAKYSYNALNWRIVKEVNADLSTDNSIDDKRVMYYSASAGGWQLLEERIDDHLPSGDDRVRQYIWGARGIDDIIAQRTDGNLDGDFVDAGIDSTRYHLTDAQFSTTALVTETGQVLERMTYDAYGASRLSRTGDLDGDGATGPADETILLAQFGTSASIADLDFDGDVDAADQSLLGAAYGPAPPAGQLSLIDNTLGFAAYLFNAETQQYCVRHRIYDTTTGRWLERDPAGYADGASLYEYCASSPSDFVDPSGLARDPQLPATLWADQFALSSQVWADFGEGKIDHLTLLQRLRCLDSIENEWVAQHARELYDQENSVLYKAEGSATLVGNFLSAGLLDTYLDAWGTRTSDQYQGWGFDAARNSLQFAGAAVMFLQPGGTIGVVIRMADLAYTSYHAFMLGYSIGRGDWMGALEHGIGTALGAYGARGPNLSIRGARVPAGVGTRSLKLPPYGKVGSTTAGRTSWTGQMALNRGLPWPQKREALIHESVHRWLTAPGIGPRLNWRQKLTKVGYEHSAFLRGVEEMIAQGYTRSRISGSWWTGIREGFAFPFARQYVTPGRFALEVAGIGGAGVAGHYFFVRDE